MKTYIRLFALIFTVLALTALLTACSDSLTGTWSYREEYEGDEAPLNFEILFTFRDDGTGVLKAPDVESGFSYATDGDTLTVTYTSGQGKGSSVTYTYSFDDGSLILKNNVATLKLTRAD